MQGRQLEASGFSSSSLETLCRCEKQLTGRLISPEDLEVRLVGLGEKIPCLWYFSKSVESNGQNLRNRRPQSRCSHSRSHSPLGVGTTVATAHTAAQRVAIAAPVATWEDGAGEAVAHGVWVGRLGEQGMNFLSMMDSPMLPFFIYPG